MLTDWRPDYISAAVAALVVIGYVRARKRANEQGLNWPRYRDVYFGVGMLAVVWTTCGFPQARGGQLMWVWTSQLLLLLLILPIIVIAGQPVSLIRAVSGEKSWLIRILNSRPLRVLGNPLVGPALVPVLCLLLFFSPLGEAAASSAVIGGVMHVVMLIVGALIVLPLIDADDRRSSLAVGMALAIGFVELILDAFPGIALRFQTHLRIPFFGVNRPAWAGFPIQDQRIAGNILWVVSELIDLPFLVLAATLWIKADSREAARIDAELDAKAPVAPDGTEPTTDRPWWVDDPSMKERFSR